MKIEGFFSGIKSAEEAVSKLKKEGFINSRVDLNEHNRGGAERMPRIAGKKNGANLSSLVLDTQNYTSDGMGSAIKAASPMVSGMGNFEEIANINYKVIVEAETENEERAKELIKKFGGDLESYNLDLHKSIKI